MKESALPAPVREQFSIITENIKTLTKVRKEVGGGPLGARVEAEVASQILALGTLRERVFNGTVTGGNVMPLEEPPSRVEVHDLSDTGNGHQMGHLPVPSSSPSVSVEYH